MVRYFRDSFYLDFHARILPDAEHPCFWVLQVERADALIEDLTGFVTFDAAYGYLMHRYPLMEEVA